MDKPKGEQSSKLRKKRVSCSGTKDILIIVTESVVLFRRLRWDTYCRNDPNEYGLSLIDEKVGVYKAMKIYPCVLH